MKPKFKEKPMHADVSIYLHPQAKHDKLSSNEMAMLFDVCNPGFEFQRQTWNNDPEMLAITIRANVEDSFRLYPDAYERKWTVNREEMLKKLWEMTPGELAKVADQVDAFWTEQSGDVVK